MPGHPTATATEQCSACPLLRLQVYAATIAENVLATAADGRVYDGDAPRISNRRLAPEPVAEVVNRV